MKLSTTFKTLVHTQATQSTKQSGKKNKNPVLDLELYLVRQINGRYAVWGDPTNFFLLLK